MADFRFNHGVLKLFNGSIDIDNSTFKVMLVSTDWVDQSNREDLDVIGLNSTADFSTDHPIYYEPSTATGYERQTLASVTLTEVDGSNRVDADASDVTFSSVSSGAGVIGAAIMAAELAANDSSGRVLFTAYESGFPVTPNGGDITVQWATGGFAQGTT